MNFFHEPGLGDVIYSLPLIKSFGGGNLYLEAKDKNYFEAFVLSKSFLERQDYIDSVKVLYYDDNQKIDVEGLNLNSFRYRPDHSVKDLVTTHFLGVGIIPPKKVLPWLKVKEIDQFYPVVVHRTRRHLGPNNYDFLYNLCSSDIYCIGLSHEVKPFVEKYNATWVQTPTMDLMASVINSAGVFVGNQSCPLSIAVGLGKARIVERFSSLNNCEFFHYNERTMTTDQHQNWDLFKELTC